MSDIVKQVKELSFSEDDALLRKHGLLDDDGYTDEAIEIVDQILVEEHKQDLIDKLKAIEAKEAK